MNYKLPEEVKKFFAESGKKGGKTTLRKHGAEHFKKMIAKRWSKHKKSGEK